MKIPITIEVEKDLYETFSNFARKKGTNSANLMNMLMINSINKRKSNLGLEVEPFSDEEIKSFGEDFIKKTVENTKKLEKLLANI